MKRDRIFRMMMVSLLAAVQLSPWSAHAGAEAVSSRASVDLFKDVPVTMATGELELFERPDISLKTRGFVLSVQRNYKSGRNEEGIFGYGWRWTHADKLTFGGGGLITIATPGGDLSCIEGKGWTNKYAQTCPVKYRWQLESAATGRPDGWGGIECMARTKGFYAGTENLVAYGWGFSDPGGTTIDKVELVCGGLVEHDWANTVCGCQVKLHAGGTSLWAWGQAVYAWHGVDITGDRDSWSWSDVNNVVAHKALNFLRRLRDGGEYEFWTGAMQRAEVVFFMRAEEEEQTLLFLAQFETARIDQTIVDEAGSLYRRWNPSHGVDPNDALLAATAKITGGKIFCLNKKHYPMPDVIVARAW